MNVNRFWPSKVAGVEAWSSALSAPTPRHAHDCYQISFTRSGRGLVHRADQVHDCLPGGVVVIRPGEAHALEPCGGRAWEFDTLYLPPLGGPSHALYGPAEFGSPRLTDAVLYARLVALHRNVVCGTGGSEQADALRDVLVRLVEVTGGSTARPDPRKAALVRVQEFLGDNPDKPITLADLAALAGVGEFHLSRRFRQAFGLPPHAFHLQVRVNQARAFLRDGVPVAEVAARTGFADQAHLTRHFRRLVGVTPGLYRATSRTFKTVER